MKKLAGVALVFLLVCAGQASAQGPSMSKTTPAKGSGAAAAVQQVERDWIEAMKKGDADKLASILADDWVGVNVGSGEDGSRQAYLNDVKTGALKLESTEVGPMDVKVLGDVAVVQGSSTDKSTYKGKDISGKYYWMDVFVERSGKWVAVRSQVAAAK